MGRGGWILLADLDLYLGEGSTAMFCVGWVFSARGGGLWDSCLCGWDRDKTYPFLYTCWPFECHTYPKTPSFWWPIFDPFPPVDDLVTPLKDFFAVTRKKLGRLSNQKNTPPAGWNPGWATRIQPLTSGSGHWCVSSVRRPSFHKKPK